MERGLHSKAKNSIWIKLKENSLDKAKTKS